MKILHNRNTKPKQKQNNLPIYYYHNEKLRSMEQKKNDLPKLRIELATKENLLNQINQKKISDLNESDLTIKSDLIDEIDKLRNNIRNVDTSQEALDYAFLTMDILEDYDSGNLTDDYQNNDESLLDKQNIKYYISKPKITKANPSQTKRSVQELFMNKINPNQNPLKQKKTNICINCGGECRPDYDQCSFICDKCGLVERRYSDICKSNFQDQTPDNNAFAYKRKNHLTEILSQLQAKESTQIPDEIYEKIELQIIKKRLDKKSLDIFKLRKILKSLGLRKYYEHVSHILNMINNKAPPQFTKKDEKQIKLMFDKIQKPFDIYKPKTRKNFLNYSYVLHKFCELLGLHQYLQYFPLLKNNKKLLEHDKIWKNICRCLGWKYIPSM